MIPYGRQSIDAADIDAVVEVLKSDFLTQGPANRLGEISPRPCYRCDEGVVLWSRDGVARASRTCGSVKPALAGTRNSLAGRTCH